MREFISEKSVLLARKLRDEEGMTWDKIGERVGHSASALRRRYVGESRHKFDYRETRPERKNDSMTGDGSERLARRIEAYWKDRGKKPWVWIDEEKLGTSVLSCVRSDMVNGVPQ